MPISAILGIGSAVIGGISASKSARAEVGASRGQLALQQQVYDETSENFDPYRESGESALAAYNYELGLGPRPTIGGQAPDITEVTTQNEGAPGQIGWLGGFQQGGGDQEGGQFGQTPFGPTSTTAYNVGDQSFGTREEAQAYADANMTGGTPYQGFQESASFNNMLTAGRDTIEAGASRSGSLFSGRTGTALEKFRMGLASNEVNTFLNRLGALGQQGQSAAGNQAAAGTNFAQMGSSAIANRGNAQAAGAIGVGNAISGGINTGLGTYGFLSGQDNNFLNPDFDIFGGNSWG